MVNAIWREKKCFYIFWQRKHVLCKIKLINDHCIKMPYFVKYSKLTSNEQLGLIRVECMRTQCTICTFTREKISIKRCVFRAMTFCNLTLKKNQKFEKHDFVFQCLQIKIRELIEFFSPNF